MRGWANGSNWGRNSTESSHQLMLTGTPSGEFSKRRCSRWCLASHCVSYVDAPTAMSFGSRGSRMTITPAVPAGLFAVKL